MLSPVTDRQREHLAREPSEGKWTGIAAGAGVAAGNHNWDSLVQLNEALPARTWWVVAADS